MNNAERIITQSNMHVSNINRSLKDIKLEICTNFIHSDNKSIIITTNKIVLTLDIETIKKYMKNLNNVDLNEVISPRLPNWNLT